ncbi:MAG: hypothetical protein AVDCRST_MAG35-478, partial [uncultured Quadrisphaera sp.]
SPPPSTGCSPTRCAGRGSPPGRGPSRPGTPGPCWRSACWGSTAPPSRSGPGPSRRRRGSRWWRSATSCPAPAPAAAASRR